MGVGQGLLTAGENLAQPTVLLAAPDQRALQGSSLPPGGFKLSAGGFKLSAGAVTLSDDLLQVQPPGGGQARGQQCRPYPRRDQLGQIHR